MSSIKVLSLFDGISCGRVALDRAQIPVETYWASEIDAKAILVSSKNYPDIVQIGDVTTLDWSNYMDADLIMGGSPCQGFSTIGAALNFDDPRSKLYFEFERAVKTIKPKYFLLENVKMRKDHIDFISDRLGVQPVEINSSLVSAQSRKRLYWTNIPIAPLSDKHIYLDDIIDHSLLEPRVNNFERSAPMGLGQYVDPYNTRVIINGKSNTLRTNVNNGNMWVAIPGGYRNLTRAECEQLQTMPEGYTLVPGVSDNQAKRMMGNGWTVDVIAHILKGTGE